MDDGLTENERAALDELVFELSAPHTLESIADHLGMSRFAVARVEQRALRKLRALAGEDWGGGLTEPARLGRRLGETIAASGSPTKPWSDGETDGSRS